MTLFASMRSFQCLYDKTCPSFSYNHDYKMGKSTSLHIDLSKSYALYPQPSTPAFKPYRWVTTSVLSLRKKVCHFVIYQFILNSTYRNDNSQTVFLA